MRKGWIALLLLVATAVACGGPTVTDIGNPGSGPSATPDDLPPGPTPPPSPTPTASGATPTATPSAAPTLPPGVPSYSGWVANVQGLGGGNSTCLNCHENAELTYMVPASDTNPFDLKYGWFTHLCNYNDGTGRGIQSYNPPTGETVDFFCNQQNPQNAAHKTHPGGTVPSGYCTPLKNWLATGTGTPPLCNGSYDIVDSQ